MAGHRMAGQSGLEAVAQAICNHKRLTYGGCIGHGTYKETFLVRRPPSGKAFALKILKPGMRPERIHREIVAMHRCVHPNIVQLRGFDSFDADGRTALYFVEPFLRGGTLAHRIMRGQAPAAAEVRDLGRQLSAAIAYLASVKLVHRDIKPENIMFDEDGARPLLVDFGLVRDLSSESLALTLTHLQRGPGTPLYSAPEQLNNRRAEIDWRTDQFALGVVLSVAAFGFHPYANAGDSSNSVADRVAAYGTHTRRFLTAAKAARLGPLIRMTCALPDQRYATPGELMAAWEAG
jgi:serine/threonine protein kinase